MAKLVTLESLIEYVSELEQRIAQLEQSATLDVWRRHTLSVLRDVLTDQLQDMSDDEFVDEDEEIIEEIK